MLLSEEVKKLTYTHLSYFLYTSVVATGEKINNHLKNSFYRILCGDNVVIFSFCLQPFPGADSMVYITSADLATGNGESVVVMAIERYM